MTVTTNDVFTTAAQQQMANTLRREKSWQITLPLSQESGTLWLSALIRPDDLISSHEQRCSAGPEYISGARHRTGSRPWYEETEGISTSIRSPRHRDAVSAGGILQVVVVVVSQARRLKMLDITTTERQPDPRAALN
ncbi:hypothetical protein VTO42DRAFT_1951 [Malbranchea cinnamomea]